MKVLGNNGKKMKNVYTKSLDRKCCEVIYLDTISYMNICKYLPYIHMHT